MGEGRKPRRIAAGAGLLAAAFGSLALFDRVVGGILFLGGLSLLLDGVTQFHALFALLFPLLALVGAILDASRGLLGAALRWSVGVGVLFALGRGLRRLREPLPQASPALQALSAELAVVKARRDRGEITEEEFRTGRAAAVAAFQRASSETPPARTIERP